VGVHARAGGAAHASREFNECQLEEKGEDEVAISIYTAKQTQWSHSARIISHSARIISQLKNIVG
jgi:hypothetical protein